MVVDFADIETAVEERVLAVLDHTNLNDTIENPTAEEIVRWCWRRLEGTDLPIKELRLYETPTCFVVYAG
jgi:6-pyruvoyltetrahydropterin/6-carboxytetrahydropterin synthase